MVGSLQFTHANLADTLEALRHDFHVRIHNGLAEPAKFLHVLLADNLAELLRRDAKIRKQGRDRKERAEKSVALHAKLQVGAISRFAGYLEAGQSEHADILPDDLLASPQREALPSLLTFLLGLPHQATALGHSIQRVGMRECLRIAAEHDVDVAKVAIHANSFRRGDHKIGGG